VILDEGTPLVFLDESGDHGLSKVDPTFPVFVLCAVCTTLGVYRDRVLPAFNRFKMNSFGHEGVILHSFEIRKKQGPFSFLVEPSRRDPWMEELGRLMKDLPYTLICVGIHKERHLEQYGPRAAHPYHYAMRLLLERIQSWQQTGDRREVLIWAESRGKAEDQDLLAEFGRVASSGTEYRDFQGWTFRLGFIPKTGNSIGCQIADLAAYPVARHILDPSKQNQTFCALDRRWLRKGDRNIGLKVLP
jgi:Protein of unknown function (DUF3800)